MVGNLPEFSREVLGFFTKTVTRGEIVASSVPGTASPCQSHKHEKGRADFP
jgi:hypothetical protein